VAQLGELPLTDLAAVRLNAQVDPRVLRQIRGVGERLRALRALVRLRLAHVDLRVELQVRLATEYLQKERTPCCQRGIQGHVHERGANRQFGNSRHSIASFVDKARARESEREREREREERKRHRHTHTHTHTRRVFLYKMRINEHKRDAETHAPPIGQCIRGVLQRFTITFGTNRDQGYESVSNDFATYDTTSARRLPALRAPSLGAAHGALTGRLCGIFINK